jgi:hypothetical protein
VTLRAATTAAIKNDVRIHCTPLPIDEAWFARNLRRTRPEQRLATGIIGTPALHRSIRIGGIVVNYGTYPVGSQLEELRSLQRLAGPERSPLGLVA